MNGSGKDRCSKNFEKISKRLKAKNNCYLCQESESKKKEVHHIDKDKKNQDVRNLIVLCTVCHRLVHKDSDLIKNFNGYKPCGFSVKVACNASSVNEWFDSTLPLKLLPISPTLAMKFRKRFIKGFIIPGSNNLYIGAFIGNTMFGVLGFSNPSYGNYDLFMKADTTPSEWEKSTDLLLFCLRTKQCQDLLEYKFNRKIETIYSMCFSKHQSIQRYKKHGKLENKKEVEGGFNLGYIFKTGEIPTLKEAKAQFIQKSWKK